MAIEITLTQNVLNSQSHVSFSAVLASRRFEMINSWSNPSPWFVQSLLIILQEMTRNTEKKTGIRPLPVIITLCTNINTDLVASLSGDSSIFFKTVVHLKFTAGETSIIIVSWTWGLDTEAWPITTLGCVY